MITSIVFPTTLTFTTQQIRPSGRKPRTLRDSHVTSRSITACSSSDAPIVGYLKSVSRSRKEPLRAFQGRLYLASNTDRRIKWSAAEHAQADCYGPLPPRLANLQQADSETLIVDGVEWQVTPEPYYCVSLEQPIGDVDYVTVDVVNTRQLDPSDLAALATGSVPTALCFPAHALADAKASASRIKAARRIKSRVLIDTIVVLDPTAFKLKPFVPSAPLSPWKSMVAEEIANLPDVLDSSAAGEAAAAVKTVIERINDWHRRHSDTGTPAFLAC